MYSSSPNHLIYLILHLVVSAISLLFTAHLVRGFQVKGFGSAVIAALAIGVANAVLWPILFFMTLPLSVLTLGLFTFVVNGAVLKICAILIPGFSIQGWGAAIFGAIVLSLVSTAMHYFLV